MVTGATAMVTGGPVTIARNRADSTEPAMKAHGSFRAIRLQTVTAILACNGRYRTEHYGHRPFTARQNSKKCHNSQEIGDFDIFFY